MHLPSYHTLKGNFIENIPTLTWVSDTRARIGLCCSRATPQCEGQSEPNRVIYAHEDTVRHMLIFERTILQLKNFGVGRV